MGVKTVQEEDYVQQMMKANNHKMGLGFNTSSGGLGNSGNDSIKVIRSERKTKKRGKRAIKV